jgi:hypothetical protein
VVAVGLIVHLSQPAPPPPTIPSAYEANVTKAVTLMAEDLVDVGQGDQDWAAGTTSGSDQAALIQADLPDFIGAVTKVAALPEFPGVPAARNLFVQAVRLDVEYARVEQDATAVPKGPMQTQLRGSAARIRTLSDRIFDDGRFSIDPGAFTNTNPDVEVILPTDVPDWVADGMAPGPPLDATPPPADTTAPSRQATRPSEPAGTWLSQVKHLDLPSAKAVAGDITDGNPAVLRQTADQLTKDAAAIWALPDPGGDRARSAAFSLAVLIEAEAARTAEAASLSRLPGLTTEAERLALIADRLWDPSLGHHHSGFAASLLAGPG